MELIEIYEKDVAEMEQKLREIKENNKVYKSNRTF